MFGFFRRMMLRDRSRKGQTTAEYAIIVALIAIASITVFLVFGGKLRALISGGSDKLEGVQDTYDDYSDDESPIMD